MADPNVLAAVQAAHFERWRRLYSRSPIFVPSGFREAMPESAQSIPGLLTAAKSTDRFATAAVTALARTKNDDLVERAVQQLKQRDWPKACRQMAAALAPLDDDPFKYNKLLNSKASLERATEAHQQARERRRKRPAPEPVSKPEPAKGCVCGAAFAICKGTHKYDAEGAAADPTDVEVLRHHANLSFDPDTFISEAIEYVVIEATQAEAEEVMTKARPQNWAKFDDDSGDFFKTTAEVEEDGETLTGTDSPINEQFATAGLIKKSFFLREIAAWQTNRNLSGSTDVVLQIQGYREKSTTDTKGRIVLKHSFDYRLRECRETQLLIARSRGGINVDEGSSELRWIGSEDPAQKGRLFIQASKRLRFSSTREINIDLMRLLNFTAPALLSMLMQRLVFDGPLELITAKRKAAKDAAVAVPLQPREGEGEGEGPEPRHSYTECLAPQEDDRKAG